MSKRNKKIPKDLKRALIIWEKKMHGINQTRTVTDERGNIIDLKALSIIGTSSVFDEMRALISVSIKYIYR